MPPSRRRYLGLKAVIAKSFARIHRQNLLNFGILPLTFVDPADWEKIHQNDVLVLSGLREAIRRGSQVKVINKTKEETYITEHAMTDRQIEMVLAGSLINVMRERIAINNQRPFMRYLVLVAALRWYYRVYPVVEPRNR